MISYQDLKGNLKTLEADGLLSVCIQHEMDHLVGMITEGDLIIVSSKLLEDFLSRDDG